MILKIYYSNEDSRNQILDNYSDLFLWEDWDTIGEGKFLILVSRERIGTENVPYDEMELVVEGVPIVTQ